jgi:hypothetical protein
MPPGAVRSLPLLPLALLALLGQAPRFAPADPPAPPAAAPVASAEHLLGAASPAERATFAFLEHLGWRFVADPAAAKVAVQPGQPGWRVTLAEAHAAGDLLTRVPPTPAGAAELREMLPQFVDGSATKLAWQYRIEYATYVALNKLIALVNNGRMKFPQLFFWDSPFFQFNPPPPQWGEKDKVWLAVSPKASQAIEAWYDRGGLAECYSAQGLALWTAQYELLGREAFDETYKPEEVVVGRPLDVRRHAIGQAMLPDRTYPFRALFLKPHELKHDPGTLLARLGPRAFAGISGIVRAQDESDTCNQNLISVTMSNRACEQLRDRGGMTFVRELGTRMWKAHAASRAGVFQGRNPKAKAELDAILAEPVLKEWSVYIHPFGAQPLGEMMLREVRDNNRPVYTLLYIHGREDLFYQRYRATFERRWLRERGL